MFKYLLHSSLANYDATSKTWKFELDRRISNPTSLRVAKITYSTPGDTSPHPQVVYLRSNALARMVTQKHTLELREKNHENGTNIFGVLSETHTRGRYRLLGGRRFPVNPSASERNIDIYFTDGDTILDGAAGSGGSSHSGGSSGTGADTQIEAFNDLLAWFDFAPSRTLDNSFNPVSTAGSAVRYLYNRSPAPASLILTAGNPMLLANMGSSGGIGAVQDSGYFFLDSTTPTAAYGQEWQVHHLFQAQSNFNQGIYLFDNYYGAFFCDPQGQCGVLNGSGGTTVLFCNNLTWIPLHPYILSFSRASLDPDGDGVFEYYYVLRLEDLSTDAVQTETVPAGRASGTLRIYMTALFFAQNKLSHDGWDVGGAGQVPCIIFFGMVFF